MNKEQLDYIENNIDNAESIGALSFGWADNVRELVREMRKDQRVLLTISSVGLTTPDSIAELKTENAKLRAENERLSAENALAQTESERRRTELTVMLNERLLPLEQKNARLRAAFAEINDLMITPWLVKDIIHSKVGDIVFKKGGAQ